ncbi:MAG: chromosomal replication initiator protein DnaA [Phycisphaerales bacterium]|nr:MAG: chromosomal replication initiator protein DnaA [Phycisphaerales bacterium]
MSVCAEDALGKVESQLAEKLGPQRFNVWFKNATRFDFTDNYLRVSAPNPFISDWIERHFSEVITEAAREVTGNDYTLSFAIDPELARGLGKKQPDRQVDFIANNPERLARQQKRPALDTAGPAIPLKGRIEDFVVGPSNRLAQAAASSVIEQPAADFNPLFIHGGCGLGKTHLLQAICNGISEHHPQLRWRYVTGEEFTNDYVYSIKAHEENVFRTRYRALDVLVIDDVHFFANKRATQEEFLHTFKAIDAAGKQIVLASDAPPKMIGHFSESLVSRFLSGMVVRIDSPDVEVRAGVLRRRAERMKVDISDRVIMHIAENFCANLRELEGALLKVVALAHLTSEPITLGLADRAIRDLIRQTAPVVKLSDIESVSAIFFGLTPADLHTSRKSRTIALSRGIAMYLARKHTDMSYPEIGRFMGNKNHSTVILATRRISNMLQANATVRWLTPSGDREQNLATLVTDLEEQIGLAGEGNAVQEVPQAVPTQTTCKPGAASQLTVAALASPIITA